MDIMKQHFEIHMRNYVLATFTRISYYWVTNFPVQILLSTCNFEIIF